MITGAKLARKIKKLLKGLNYSKVAIEKLEDLTFYYGYFLEKYDADDPDTHYCYDLISDYLEEFFTLRIERYQIYVIAGIENVDDDKYISFVSVAFPKLGWEQIEEFKKDAKSKTPDELWDDWDYSNLEDFYDNLISISDVDQPLRFYYPIMSEFVEEPFDNENLYKKRREILIQLIELLYKNFGFKIFSSQSGDIPHEVPDECIHLYVLNEYNQKLKIINDQLMDDEKNGFLWYQKAGLLLSRDRSEEALNCLKKAVKLNPDSHEIWYTLADTYTKLGNDKKAKFSDTMARKIMKRDDISIGSPDVFHYGVMFTPIYISQGDKYQSYDDDEDKLICIDCDYDFLYIMDGINYVCNRCGKIYSIEDAALDVMLTMDNTTFESDLEKPILLKVMILNKTKFEISYQTSHEGMEFIFWTVEEEDKKKDDRKSISRFQVNFGVSTKPYKRGILIPNQKLEFIFDVRKIEWLDDNEQVDLTIPGKYAIDLFVMLRVFRNDETIESNSTSNVVEFEII